jgi:hypothetical protein
MFKSEHATRVFKDTTMRSDVLRTADDQFATTDYSPRLCKLLRDVKKEEPKIFNKIVRSRTRCPLSRQMVDWWEDHKKRKKQEKAAAKTDSDIEDFVEGLTGRQAALLKKILKDPALVDSALAWIATRESEE